ncbi:UNVERIFIED_CONTAM: hypothetical protein Scaly_2946200 [Sesamum calycinum]|uniref:FLZ-type domain-containing protein n=1 Tax=Sesamum calycinum TaxID=2727403 RepID=A0AAW2KTA1_9LAMI
MKQKVGLYIPDDDMPSEEARIIFKTRNLTKTLIENNMMMMLNSKPSKGKEVVVDELVGPTSPNLIKPCLLSSIHNYVPIISGSNQSRGRLPLTTCTKHGTVGFLPLEYVRELPEYTCTMYKYPTYKIVHTFDDCILEFPRTEVAGSSSTTKHVQDDEYLKKCYTCRKKLSKPIDIFMYRDTPYCCIECRYDAFESYCWNKKKMKDNDSDSSSSLDEDLMFCMGSSTSASMDEDTIFCIGSS